MPSQTMTIQQIQFGSPEYDSELRLRYTILREPLGLQFDPADLELESGDIHLAALDENQTVVGCVLLRPASDTIMKMRQAAVASHLQGTGIGKKLVATAEEYALLHGYNEITMHARGYAVSFYEKLGYEVYGEEFTEVTIPHRYMRKILTKNLNP